MARHVDAVRNSIRIVRAHPDDPEAWFTLAKYLGRSNRATCSVRCFEKAVTLDPEDPTKYVYLSLACSLAGLLQRGMSAARTAAMLDPEDERAILFQAIHHDLLGDFESAEAMFEAAKQMAPGYGAIYGYHARMLLRLGERDLAMRELERGLGFDAECEICRQVMAAAKEGSL